MLTDVDTCSYSLMVDEAIYLSDGESTSLPLKSQTKRRRCCSKHTKADPRSETLEISLDITGYLSFQIQNVNMKHK